MSKLAQIKAMRKDKDIQSLLNKASSILKNPIAMFDTNYTLIANTDVVTDDPIWNELVSTGTFSLETQKFFADIYFTYDVSNTEKVVVLKSDMLKHDRVLANVYNRDRIKVANLVMVACNTPFDADDIVTFNAFAEKIESKIRDDDHYTEFAKLVYNNLITMLLNGEIKDTKMYAPHMKILYDGFDVWLHIAVIGSSQDGAQQDKLENVKKTLMEKNKSYKFALYSGYVVMIMSSSQIEFNRKRALGKHEEFFEQNELTVGISSGFENLYELRKYYDEAVASLSNT